MKAKTKKIIGGTLALSLVAATAIGGTLAYLTRQTEKRVNNFTFAKSDVALNAMLTEPAWDGIVEYEYDGGTMTPIYGYTTDGEGNKVPVYGYKDGDRNQPVTDKLAIDDTTKRPTTNAEDTIITYGIDQSKSMIPGSTAAKNPIITNIGNQVDSWVAAKITFVYASGDNAGEPLNTVDMAKVTDIIDIDYNSQGTDAKWEEIRDLSGGSSKTFFYTETLTKDSDPTPGVYGGETVPLFTTVSVKPEAKNAQIDELNTMGGFVIYVEGYAVQSDVATNYDGFKAWGNSNVVFKNTPSDGNPVDVTKLIVPAE